MNLYLYNLQIFDTQKTNTKAKNIFLILSFTFYSYKTLKTDF